MEFTILNVLWNPGCFLIVLNKVIFEGSDSNEPGSHSFIDEGRITSPAERIIVDTCAFLDNSSFFFKIFHNEVISIFDIHSFEHGYLFCKSSILINRHRWVVCCNDFLFYTHFVIVLSKARSTVNNTGTI